MRFHDAAAAIAVVASSLTGVAQAAATGCDEVVGGQYLGTKITNKLFTKVKESEITFFKIKDPSGQHVCKDDAKSDLSLINYVSLNKNLQRLKNDEVVRVVIVNHGLLRDPVNYHEGMVQALQQVEDDAISLDNVLVIAPYYPNGNDKGKGYPYNADGEHVADRFPSPALVWSSDYWSAAGMNLYPPSVRTVSSFDVLDQLVQYYGSRDRFPNLNQIVVAGHSLGAQMVQRYVAVGKTRQQLGVDVPVSYWIGDPNSLLWLDDERPMNTGQCDIYNNWREGLDSYEQYGAEKTTEITYNTDLVSRGADAVRQNYLSKQVHYGRALLDHGDNTGDCAPYTTGTTRHERFYEFIKAFPLSCPEPTGERCNTLDLVVSTHDAPTMFRSVGGKARLFTDNFHGKGGKMYDQGYPRLSAYDSPYPDPAQVGKSIDDLDTKNYAGGMTYQGCYTDIDNAQTEQTLSLAAYNGTQNSRDFCAKTCSDKKFAIAGLSGNVCWCGNQLSEQTAEVVDSSCNLPCPANKDQMCGLANRLSILSTKDLRVDGTTLGKTPQIPSASKTGASTDDDHTDDTSTGGLLARLASRFAKLL